MKSKKLHDFLQCKKMDKVQSEKFSPKNDLLALLHFFMVKKIRNKLRETGRVSQSVTVNC